MPNQSPLFGGSVDQIRDWNHRFKLMGEDGEMNHLWAILKRQFHLPRSALFRSSLWINVALFAAIVAAYGHVWHHGFVNLDDGDYVSKNPNVANGVTWRALWWAFTAGYAANWHPLTWLSHMLDVQLYGLDPGPHHVTSLCLHIVNSIFLFGLLRRLTDAPGKSAVVAALFAVHPLHVESVAWLAERKDVLSTLFWMLTLRAYLVYVRQHRLWRYMATLFFFGLGLMAKPMLVTLPFVLLLLDFWPLGRVVLETGNPSCSGGCFPRDQLHAWLPLVKEKLPLLVLSVVSGIVTLVVQAGAGAVSGFGAIPINVRLANAAVSYVRYIGKMLWPSRLAVFYPYPPGRQGWLVIASVIFLFAVSALVIRAAQRRPYLLVGWLWYVVTLVPVIGLVQVGAQAMADRYSYVPLIGLFVLMTWGIADLSDRWRNSNRALPVAALSVLLVYTAVTRVQVRHWDNSLALWEHALKVTAENSTAHVFLGLALCEQGKFEEAIVHFNEALRIRPNYPDGENAFGAALASQGRFDEAIAHFNKALRLKPDFAEAHSNLGLAMAKQGRFDEAIAHYTSALLLDPTQARTHNNLGLALAKQGRTDEAILEFLEAVRIVPGQADWHYNLAVSLGDRGEIAEAIRQLEIALKLNPDHANAWRLLTSLKR